MIKAHAIAPAARAWMQTASGARVLHVFDRACNLVEARGGVLSLVASELGAGPFAIVVSIDAPFSAAVTLDAPVTICDETLTIGSVSIDTTGVPIETSRPRWASARSQIDRWRHAICDQPAAGIDARIAQRVRASLRELCAALAAGDVEGCRSVALRLAGLGGGLTPTGDDVLVGALHAIWLTKPMDEAARCARAIADAAAPLTTSLSSAWLRAAARGEASAPWCALIDAWANDDRLAAARAVQRILATGHSSGADAWLGFVTVLGSASE
jgi:hypothetical protein